MTDYAVIEDPEDPSVWERVPIARTGAIVAGDYDTPGGQTYWLNRARKTGGGITCWVSPTVDIDTAGNYYPGGDWGDVVEVVGLRTWQE